MKNKQKIKSSGFSLVEVLMVLGILGAAALVVMQLTKSLTKSTVKAGFDSDVLLITNEINAILSDPDKCLTTFASTASPSSINNAKYYIQGHASAPAKGYGNGNVEISSYQLASSTAPPDPNLAVLTISFINKNILKGVSGASMINKQLNLYIEGVPGTISKCRALSTASSDIWTRGTGSFSDDIFYTQGKVGIGISGPGNVLDIRGDKVASGNLGAQVYVRDTTAFSSTPTAGIGFVLRHGASSEAVLGGIHLAKENTTDGDRATYMSLVTTRSGWAPGEKVRITSMGRVGIGTNNPAAMLDVNAGIKAAYGEPTGVNSNASGFSFDGDTGLFAAADGQMYLWSNNVRTMSVLNGSVGIGSTTPVAKLDVAGEAKLGNTGLACSASTAGAMRYNSGIMEFCNGSSWAAIGGGGTQVNLYRCPTICAGCSGGSWGYYGCQGQYTSNTICQTIEWPCTVTCSCTYVGKITLQP